MESSNDYALARFTRSLRGTPLCACAAIVLMAASCGCRQRDPPQANWIRVRNSLPGWPADEVEDQLTRPLEQLLIQLPTVQHVQSVTRAEETIIWLRLSQQIGHHDGLCKVAAALQQLELPVDASEPRLGSIASGPILLVALHRTFRHDDPYSLAALHTLAQDLKWRLYRVPHVAEVSMLSGHDLRFEVSVTRQRLDAANLTVEDVAASIQWGVLTKLQNRDDTMLRRVATSTLEVLSEFPVSADPDHRVVDEANENVHRLRDVAEVRLRRVANAELESIEGGPSWPLGWILLGVQVESAEHASACSEAIERELASFELSDGVEVVRDLADRRNDMLALATACWVHLGPHDLALEYATSPEWKSHLVLARSSFCRVRGPDPHVLRKIGSEVRERLEKHPGVRSAMILGGATRPGLHIEVDREWASRVLVQEQDVRRDLKTGWDDNCVAGARVQDHLVAIAILVDGKPRSPEECVSHRFLRDASGKTIPVQEVCQITATEEPAQIWHDQQERFVCVRVIPDASSPASNSELRRLLRPLQERLERKQPDYRIEVAVP